VGSIDAWCFAFSQRIHSGLSGLLKLFVPLSIQADQVAYDPHFCTVWKRQLAYRFGIHCTPAGRPQKADVDISDQNGELPRFVQFGDLVEPLHLREPSSVRREGVWFLGERMEPQREPAEHHCESLFEWRHIKPRLLAIPLIEHTP
jgi:hypothetical protein